ncbi:bifunctional tetrahydrofolate synthase/dihydrofolate synthase [Polynucleobacter cosmopolitanus]|uniref:Dihydrofolate synthase/folylpolyglutamate synthase n=1 Tax=Polynucleobacter cosmopolitanus TaxID=351345 RepID=A0A229FU19_9BURK|nr:bifunctional tetrahydrofolate synthase/dihydrofolate synthase [Polynucleobacter cosmopolitanus]OXL14899.1 bifunctional tetrahydrofolate synthase/dihydrofolate synthase [Polynucleobacter cosmopolitanus]
MPATFDNLDDWLQHLETAHPVGIDMGLERITRVKEALQLNFQAVVFTVGGTNGKGSTCALLESVLLAASYKVGCHTSPHLLSFNERARVNGENVSDELLLEHFKAVELARASLPNPPTLTYFEFTTLAIMHLFATADLDAVILEVGLGGRLDAVNMIDTDCAIVTSIDLDHMEYLGDTREKIAFEKAGIFRSDKPAICADPVPPQSLIDHAASIGADLWLLGKDYNFQGDKQQWGWAGRGKRFSGLGYPALRGANQLLNASAVIAALIAVRDRLPVGAQEIRNGMAWVELPGRFQVLPGQPTIILDVAHNPHASAALAQNLENMAYHPYTIAVFGAMADKDIDGVLKPMMDKIDFWYFCDLPTARAASAESLATRLRSLGFKEGADSGIEVFSSPALAYESALKKAGEGDRISVFGSFYTVAGVLAYRNAKAH